LHGREAIFGALVLRINGLDAVRRILARFPELPRLDETHRIAVRESGFDAVLEFVA